MTKREEEWVNAVFAVLMARPLPEALPREIDTSEPTAEQIRADERERLASILEKNRYYDVHVGLIAGLIAWLRRGGS